MDKTILYYGVTYGDYVECVNCGKRMLVPCGEERCPECGTYGCLAWVDEQQERSAEDVEGLCKTELKEAPSFPFEN